MSKFEIITSVVMLALIVAVTILFMGNTPDVELESILGNMSDIVAWHRVKAVWLPSLLGWLLMFQLPVSLAMLGLAIWSFIQKEKWFRLRTSVEWENAHDKRDIEVEEEFQKYLDKLSPALVEVLSGEEVMTSSFRLPLKPKLQSVSAYDFFVDAYRKDVIYALEEQFPLPQSLIELEEGGWKWRSPWIDLSDAAGAAAFVLLAVLLAAPLGYALVFI